MTDEKTALELALEKLLKSDTDELFAELGLRRMTIVKDPSLAGQFELPTIPIGVAGPLDVLRDFGRRFFDRVSRDAFSLVCGSDAANAEERNKIFKAAGGANTTLAAVLTASFISWFGWAPAIAAVVAALIVRLFFKNAHTAACDVWSKHLPPGPAAKAVD
jgi:hypothetical protein